MDKSIDNKGAKEKLGVNFNKPLDDTIPFYQRMNKILHSNGKLFEGHWCGSVV